jgi:guanylate kinase
MKESEESFIPEDKKFNELRTRWEQTLKRVAESVASTMAKEIPESDNFEDFAYALEEMTEERILDKKDEADLVVISSTPGTGKTAIGKILEAQGVSRLPRVTTRQKRAGERDGHDYFFMGREEFDEHNKRGDFVYAKETYGDGRAIFRDELDQHLASGNKFYAEGDAMAYAAIQKEPGYEDMSYQSIFLLAPSFDVIIQRMERSLMEQAENSGQAIDKNELKERLEKIIFYLEKSGEHISSGIYDGFLVNDDLDRVEKKLKQYSGKS